MKINNLYLKISWDKQADIGPRYYFVLELNLPPLKACFANQVLAGLCKPVTLLFGSLLPSPSSILQMEKLSLIIFNNFPEILSFLKVESYHMRKCRLEGAKLKWHFIKSLSQAANRHHHSRYFHIPDLQVSSLGNWTSCTETDVSE